MDEPKIIKLSARSVVSVQDLLANALQAATQNAAQEKEGSKNES